MQTLHLRRVIPKHKAEALGKQFLSEKRHIKLPIVREDTDAFDLHGNLLFRFRKGAIPMEVLKLGVDSFKGSIEPTKSRGAASGSSHKRIRKDGSVSNVTEGNEVLSGNVGFMDASAMNRFCRKTAFARRYFDEFQAGIPFVEHIDGLYKEYCPEHYARQIAIAEGTNRNYRIGNTSFTTVTVNQNFRTACHQDAGDYREGFGNLIVYREGDWEGCYFTLPEYGVGIELQNTDALFVDVHRWHGNTEFKNWDDETCNRISFVLYYREYMYLCKSPSEELKRVKQDQTGYLKL